MATKEVVERWYRIQDDLWREFGLSDDPDDDDRWSWMWDTWNKWERGSLSAGILVHLFFSEDHYLAYSKP